MDNEQIFVGRKDELARFKNVLEDTQGQAVLVTGPPCMGKTMLVNRMAGLAQTHPDLKCGFVRYEVTPTDSVESTMELMMDHAFDAAQVTEGSFDGTDRRTKQWMALLKTMVPKGQSLAELIDSLRRNPAKNTRDQFVQRLNLISQKIPKNGRAVFVIDPEKYMQKDSDHSWSIVVKDLPPKIKFIFAQRPEDVLITGETFTNLPNVIKIPDNHLDILDEAAIDELLDARKPDLKCELTPLRNAISRYNGHPFAIGATLDLVAAGTMLDQLPDQAEPIGFAEKQWEKICAKGDSAIKLFEAYVVLEVPVPHKVVEAVSGLNSTTRKRLQKDSYLKTLLRAEPGGNRIYHIILADYILDRMSDDEKKTCHRRAIDTYRKLLKANIKPDALAALRLPEHILAAEGPRAFVKTFIDESFQPLYYLGLLDAAERLSQRALTRVEKGSDWHAMLLGNIGNIYFTRGELEKAEDMFQEGLKLDEKLGRIEGLAAKYGNLGNLYFRRGELEKAEKMYKKVLGIEEKLGRPESIANAYGNLGSIYLTRGEPEKAEDMYKKSLAISEAAGMVEQTAKSYGNLGNIYLTRGELDKAEDYYKKSLAICEPAGMLEQMANQYANLGLIYEQRGDTTTARQYWQKALALYEQIGIPHMVEKTQGQLDELDNKP